eukprot:CAMPEP_0180273258 /NCGR_PEP_ID=MMETSP0988-20121125/4701_1 /TAXON_ID=697907 /ORGANISM="non described non described, Strain CCMP2293" /LENGTH=182 /DNA_ID=CAMNT_0022244421 /DNA_START=215 /DNA_END=764 /DNA_ORIENTATION=-
MSFQDIAILETRVVDMPSFQARLVHWDLELLVPDGVEVRGARVCSVLACRHDDSHEGVRRLPERLFHHAQVQPLEHLEDDVVHARGSHEGVLPRDLQKLGPPSLRLRDIILDSAGLVGRVDDHVQPYVACGDRRLVARNVRDRKPLQRYLMVAGEKDVEDADLDQPHQLLVQDPAVVENFDD